MLTFARRKKIAFLLEWGKISLDKGLLMGNPFIFPISVCPGLQSRRPSSEVKNLQKRMMVNY